MDDSYLDGMIPPPSFNQISQIFSDTIDESVIDVQHIEGLGMVNQVFRVKGKRGQYALRVNEADEKGLEYRKEAACLRQVAETGIPSPRVIHQAETGPWTFMIQEWIEGINGTLLDESLQLQVWETLGRYARSYHSISSIDEAEVRHKEFHDSFASKISYNLEELNAQDLLWQTGFFSVEQYRQFRTILEQINPKEYTLGLIHGDLSMKNILYRNGEIWLLDWGTATTAPVPHGELGILSMSGSATVEEFDAFVRGMGFSEESYKQILPEIRSLQVLNRLDKFRWAEAHAPEVLDEFTQKVLRALIEFLEL